MSGMKVTLSEETTFHEDPQKRIVRCMHFICPCGKPVLVYVTKGPHFWLLGDPDLFPKAWHYEINGDRISVTPSIDLTRRGKAEEHKPECHLTISNVEVEQ